MREEILELKADLAGLEGRIDARIAGLEARLYRVLWLQGIGILAGTGAIVTIVSVLD